MHRFLSLRSFSRLLCLLAAISAGFVPSLHAQQKPRENAEVVVGVRISGYDIPTSDLFYFRLYGGGQSDRINGAWNGGGTGTFTDPGAMHTLMIPNRHYQAVLSAGSWQYSEVKFSAPAGYSIWINDRPATTYRATVGSGDLIFKIELRADTDGILPAGMAVAPHVGDLIWSISAGRYSTGLSAGAVQWRATGLSASLLDPTSLNYMEPDTAETATAWHSDGALLELRTFQMVLHVRRNTTAGTGYDIEIYEPYVTRSGSGDGPYTYSASPYRTYRISNPNGSTWNDQIKIEKIEDTTETWTITQAGANWTVVETTGLRTITRTSTGSAPRVETVEVKDASNNVATKIQRKYQAFGWGQEEMIEETSNPDASNGPALTTTYAYHTTAGTGGYGRLKSVTNPDGSWVAYEYDSSSAGFGNLTAILRPWQDSSGVSASNATTANCHATILSYAGERNVFNELSAGTETKINGTTVGKNTVSYAYPGNAPNGNPLRTETITTYTASAATLVATRQIYNPTAGSADFLGRFYSQTNPDGTKTSAVRFKGYFWNYDDTNATTFTKWGGNPLWGEFRFSGFSTQVTDSVAVYLWEGEYFSTVYMVPNRSTIQLDVFDDQGRVGHSVNYVFTGASGGVPTMEFTGLMEKGYAFGRQTASHALNGARETTAWVNASYLSGVSSNDGTYTEYTRDALGRDYLVRQWYIDADSEYPAQGILYTHKTFDIAGRVLTEKVSDSSTSSDPGLQTTRVYNVGGLLLSETAPTGLQTTYAYANGGRTVTTTFPGGATKVVDRWIDGSVKSVTGTGVVAEHHRADVNTSDGTLTTASYVMRSSDVSSPTSSPRWSKVTTDWAGRKIKEERPAPPGASPAAFTKQYFYNSVGQLTKTTETAVADTLVAYNAWQQAYRTGLDLNANGTLDLSSTDRITETDSLFEKDGNNAWWVKITTKAYNVDNNATPVTTAVAKQRLNKFDDHGRFFGSYIQSESQATDIFGNTTTKTVAVQRGSSYHETNLRLVTETVDHPDSSINEVSVSRNGMLQKRVSKQGFVYRTYYDGLRRPVKTTDPRTDTGSTARIGYYDSTTGYIGQVAWREDGAGNRTNYHYDGTDGRLKASVDPLNKAIRYSYTTRGELQRTWGDTTYPVEYAYDDYGQQVTMKTYRAGTGWTASTWPGSPGTADTTTWAFDNATGTLTSKTDAASKVVAYTYNTRGQLKTRAWARGVSTTYNYSSTTAEQTGIDYSDSTPDLTYTYNRLGQSASVTDVTGTRTFNYSTTTTQLLQEDLGSFLGTRSVASGYDTKGRRSSLGVGPTATPTTEYSLTYGYDTYGRMNQVWNFTYAYAGNSNLIASISDNSSLWTQTRTYESNRDLLDVIETKWSATSKTKFDYTTDALGRRALVAKSGEMFSRYSNGGLDTHYGYNDRSEVTSEVSKLGGTGTVLTGRDDAYAFDNIGNRSSTTHNGAGASYTANSLNQYTQRAVPASVDVTGLAPAAAAITINSSTSGITRHNDWYYKSLGVTNASSAAWQSVAVSSSLGGSSARTAFVPMTPEAFAYDDDGNLTSDGRWVYTYDAENRLVSMQTHPNATVFPIANADARRIEFKNDYLGRRVQKTVRAGWNGSSFATVVADTKFLYDGWNLLFELDAANGLAKVRSYVWGIDWSGSLGGAGGVGGLLVAYDWSTSTGSALSYDGNGNAMGMIDRANGAPTAEYEYDAFGNTLRVTGTHAAANPFRFSTKYTDSETSLVYYGLRYYSPTLGRFINKDPIGEQGGTNLYRFCSNNAINKWDNYGLLEVPSWFNGSEDDYAAYLNSLDAVNPYDSGGGMNQFEGTPWDAIISMANSFASARSAAGGIQVGWTYAAGGNSAGLGGAGGGTMSDGSYVSGAQMNALMANNAAMYAAAGASMQYGSIAGDLNVISYQNSYTGSWESWGTPNMPGSSVASANAAPTAPNSAVTNGAVGVGGVLVEAGLVRDNYNAQVRQLQATGQFDPARAAIRTQMNAPGSSTAISRSMGSLYRWEQAATGVTRSNANPTATSAAMNRAGAIAKYGGGALVVVGAGASVVTVATAPDPYRAGAQQSAGIIVGYGGASGGAVLGGAIGTAIVPGLGTGIGAVIGAVAGGIGGGYAGQEMGAGAYDALYGPPKP